MMDIGLIAYGRELERRPIFREVRRLRNALVTEGVPPAIEIVYIVPGSVGGADFEGFQKSRSRTGSRHPLVYVDVPSAVAESDDPMPALVDLVRMALEFARSSGAQERASKDMRALDFDDLFRSLDAAASLLEPGAARSPKLVARTARSRAALDESDDEDHAGVVVQLTVGDDPSAVSAAFQLEDELAQQLEATGAGYVDGNQVGQGTFEIFAYGRSLPALRDAVSAFVRDRWSAGGATVRPLDGDDKVRT